MLLTPDLIRERLKKFRVGPDKFLGQHFLIDQNVLEAMREKTINFLAESSKSGTVDMVVEVGPGLGVLTEVLTEEAPHVIAIEKDPVFAEALPEFINKPNVTVLQGDALRILETNLGFPRRFDATRLGIIRQLDPALSKIDDSVCIFNPGYDFDWLFVANIPYGITSPLLRKLVELDMPPRHVLVLMQLEVAERLIAKPGNSDRGMLTIQMELAGKTEIVMKVPKGSFWPEPQVESALVRIDLTEPAFGLSDDERTHFFKVVAAGFLMKRKKIHNSLTNGLRLPNEQVKVLLEQAGIDENRRAETLTLDEWRHLATIIPR